jgi:hypothetical protein
MWVDEPGPDLLFYQNKCFSIKCMVNNDFPRYICGTDKDDNICWQEYAAGQFYVKVSDEGTRVYRLISCMLTEDIKVPEALWLNPTNFDATLDKVQGLHYILWSE